MEQTTNPSGPAQIQPQSQISPEVTPLPEMPPTKSSWHKNLSWKIWGFLATPIVGFACFGYLFGYGFSGCRADIECAIVPNMLIGLFCVSAAFMLMYLVSFFLRSWNVKKITIVYLLLVLVGALILATFRYDGIAYNALHETEFECSLYSRDAYKHAQCVSALAAKQGDLQRCDTLPADGLENGWWRSDCLTGIAVSRKDPGLCQSAGNACILRVAQETGDPQICELIRDGIPSENWADAMSEEDCRESVSYWTSDQD